MTTTKAQHVAEQVLASYRATKLARCEAAGGPADLAMTLEVRLPTGHAYLGAIDDRRMITPSLRAIRAEARQCPAFVALAADAYARPAASPDELPEHGALERAFQGGDLSVAELLNVVVYDSRRRRFVGCSQHYTYDDRGRPIFGLTAHTTGEVEGFIPDAIRAGLR